MFESVDRRTDARTDGRRLDWYTSAFGSGELKCLSRKEPIFLVLSVNQI